MGLVDPRLLQQQGGGLMGGIQQGQQIRQNFNQGQDQQKTREAMRTFQSLAQGQDITTRDGLTNVLKGMTQAGHGDAAFKIFSSNQDLFKDTAPKAPSYQAIDTDQGKMRWNPETNSAEPIAFGGKTLTKPPEPVKSTEPTPWEVAKEKWEREFRERQLKQSGANIAKDNELSAAKWEVDKAKKEAEMAKKATDVTEVSAQADEAIALIDKMIGSEDGKVGKHPGFGGYVGAKGPSSLFGILDKPISGTDAAGFGALYDQVKGTAFLGAIEKMRGLGALGEKEGAAATSAATRMQGAQSETEFIEAAKDFRNAIKNRKGRMVSKAASGAPGMTAPTTNNDPLGIR